MCRAGAATTAASQATLRPSADTAMGRRRPRCVILVRASVILRPPVRCILRMPRFVTIVIRRATLRWSVRPGACQTRASCATIASRSATLPPSAQTSMCLVRDPVTKRKCAIPVMKLAISLLPVKKVQMLFLVKTPQSLYCVAFISD